MLFTNNIVYKQTCCIPIIMETLLYIKVRVDVSLRCDYYFFKIVYVVWVWDVICLGFSIYIVISFFYSHIMYCNTKLHISYNWLFFKESPNKNKLLSRIKEGTIKWKVITAIWLLIYSSLFLLLSHYCWCGYLVPKILQGYLE